MVKCTIFFKKKKKVLFTDKSQTMISRGIFLALVSFVVSSEHAGAEVAKREPNKNPNIIIVGAGVSGIAAATKLIENGFTNIKILEAENRIGGRINTVQIGNWTVDLGAHWVHGEKGNIVNEIASPMGLLEDSKDDMNITTVFSDGVIYEIDEVMDEYLDVLYNETLLQASKNTSLQKIMDERVKPIAKEFFKDDDKVHAYLEWLSLSTCSLEGCDSLDEVSAARNLEYEVSPGSFVMGWKGKGYKSILDILLKGHEKCQGPPIDLNGKLYLDTEVTNIEKKESGVAVRTKNGTVYEGDLVLVTVSLGVLKASHETLFQPPLPENKIKTIQNLGIGTVDKIILLFDHPWWPESNNGFGMIWLNKDKEKGQHSWDKGILDSVTERWSPNTLTVWLVGKAARDMETTSIHEVQKACMRVLRRFLGHKYTIPEPIEVIRSTWGTNPHFRGSYSFFTLQSEYHNVSRKDLETPLKDQSGREVVLFAGEATHDRFFGSVHGALETGWREAERIIKIYA